MIEKLILLILILILIINYNYCIKNKNLPSSKNDVEKITGIKSRKIFGTEVKSDNQTEEYFVGAIVYVGPCCDYKSVALSNELRVICTASILNEYYLLTTSLCLTNFKTMNQSHFIVIFHNKPLEEWRKHYDKEIFPFEHRLIEDYKLHEKYDLTRSLKNNVGIIRMNEPLNFTESKTLSKIRIPYISSFRPYCKEYYEVDLTDIYQRKCYLYSFSDDSQSLHDSDNTTLLNTRLNSFHAPIMEPRECREADSNFDPKEFICSGSKRGFQWNDKNPEIFEYSNYGGPLVCVEKNFKNNNNNCTKYQVVGIAVESLIFPYSHHKYAIFFHFASIKFFLDWIADNSEIIEN